MELLLALKVFNNNLSFEEKAPNLLSIMPSMIFIWPTDKVSLVRAWGKLDAAVNLAFRPFSIERLRGEPALSVSFFFSFFFFSLSLASSDPSFTSFSFSLSFFFLLFVPSYSSFFSCSLLSFSSFASFFAALPNLSAFSLMSLICFCKLWISFSSVS